MSERAKAGSARTPILWKDLLTKGMLATLWLIVAYLAVNVVDNFGFGYSPAVDNIFGWAINYICVGVWIITAFIALGITLWRHRHLGWFLSLLTISFSSFATYPYLSILDAFANISPAPANPNNQTIFKALPQIWPSPTHIERTQSTRDLNSDGQDETLLIDEYHVEASLNESIIVVQILQQTNDEYRLLLTQNVDEGQISYFEQECPDAPSRWLGYHSSIWLTNIDADKGIEIYVHQAVSHGLLDCRFDHVFDWKNNRLESSTPSLIWLWLHALFPYTLALLMLASDYLKKPFWLIVITILYSSWAAWEAWLGSHSWLWLAAGLVFALIILIIRLNFISKPSRLDSLLLRSTPEPPSGERG